MAMSTTTTPLELDETSKPEDPRPAEQAPAALYRYSTWLHAGVGAEQCAEVDENEGVNRCGDRAHFHAWCRLPNPLQHAEIRERALAAKARKIRQLRDPDSDAHAILQEEFDARIRQGDLARETTIDELLQLDFWRDYYEAMMEVTQIEDPHSEDEEAKLYAHIEDDQARFMRLDRLGEENRPKDEYAELEKHLRGYQEALNTALDQIRQPKRDALEALPTEQLIAQLRDKRIESESQREFQRVYEFHEWLSCAYRQPDGEPALQSLGQLEAAASEVVAALQVTFADLKRTAQEAQGN